MAVPKGAKINRQGIEFNNNVNAVEYTLKELIRAALRDSGKLWCVEFRKDFYSVFGKRPRRGKRRRVSANTQYWIRTRQETPDCLVGIKPGGFYGGFQEFGSSKTPRYGLMTKTAHENIDMFKKLQAQYLSALNDENPNIPNGEDEGGAE